MLPGCHSAEFSALWVNGAPITSGIGHFSGVVNGDTVITGDDVINLALPSCRYSGWHCQSRYEGIDGKHHNRNAGCIEVNIQSPSQYLLRPSGEGWDEGIK